MRRHCRLTSHAGRRAFPSTTRPSSICRPHFPICGPVWRWPATMSDGLAWLRYWRLAQPPPTARFADSGMMRAMRSMLAAALVCCSALSAAAQTPQRQTQEDDYTRYELLGPDTAQFRILYEVTATTAGAPFFFNAIRKGSIATDESVVDLMTGQQLKWGVVSGAQARKEGHPTADLETEWLKVYLARPVPKGGEGRVLIDKTYKDPKR